MKIIHIILVVLLLSITSVFAEDEPLNLPPTPDDRPPLLFVMPDGTLYDNWEEAKSHVERQEKREEALRKELAEKPCRIEVAGCIKIEI